MMTIIHFDPATQKFLSLKSYLTGTPKALPSIKISRVIIANDPLLKSHSGPIYLVISSSRATLVPASMFRENLRTNYFKLNFKPIAGEVIQSDSIKSLDARLIYSLPGLLLNELRTLLSCKKVFHASTPLLENIQSQYGGWDKKIMFIDLEVGFARVIAMESKKTVFFNTFNFNENTDLLYYVANTSEKTGVSLEKDHFFFSGRIHKNTPMTRLFSRYIRHPRFNKRNESFHYGKNFDQLPVHMYYHTLGMPLCVS